MPRLPRNGPAAEFTFDLEGSPIRARDGESIATALLAAGEDVFSRSIKYHRPRGPFCMSGACSNCLMRVDGAPNVFTCRTPARPGMHVERQNAFPSARVDVFGSLDWLFPRGMDHHQMFAGVPVAEQVMLRVARHLAGLGLLPDSPAPERMPSEALRVDVAIAGAGAAGLAAARELSAAGADFLLLERDEAPGGRLRLGAPADGDPDPGSVGTYASRTRLRTPVVGLFRERDGRFFAAVQYGAEGPRLLRVHARRFLVATGATPALWPFEGNDVPGVFAGRAVSLLIRRDRFLPGEAFGLVGTGGELYDLARLLERSGARIAAVVDLFADPPAGLPYPAVRGDPLRAHGRTRVKGFSFRGADGQRHRVDCDAVAICTPPSPAFELARQGGAHVGFDEGRLAFVVHADEEGRTADGDVFVAGEVAGAVTAREAAESGARAGRALAGGRP